MNPQVKIARRKKEFYFTPQRKAEGDSDSDDDMVLPETKSKIR